MPLSAAVKENVESKKRISPRRHCGVVDGDVGCLQAVVLCDSKFEQLTVGWARVYPSSTLACFLPAYTPSEA